MVKRIFKILLKIVGIFLLLIITYIGAAFALSSITSNKNFKPCEKDAVTVYILTNGVHTDLVLPFRNEEKDWSTFVHPSDTRLTDTLPAWVAFGWGDKGFYLETPTWADLKFSTAFNALFFLSTTAMHVTFYDTMEENASCRKICIEKENYASLVQYIDQSFIQGDQNPVLIKGASYADNDLFYDAHGTYSLFNTCNTWANSGLKAAGLKACLWTPFDRGIFAKYN